MKLNFLSPAYFICIGAELLFIAGCFFLLRKRRPAIQKLALLILMLLNIGQHLAKSIVWPHLWGTGFSLINTAYNVCAFLILLSPFALLSKSQGLKDFMTYVGTCGPLLAITVPYWFTGQDLLQWEVARFYVCHDLLIATSVLPALLGLHRPSYKSFWKIPLLFFLMLILILFNDAVCVVLGLAGSGTQDLFQTLDSLNPCMVMHPSFPEGFGWAQKALELFTPAVFLGKNGRPYTPLLWYAIPLYLLMAALGLILGVLFDFKRLRSDVKKIFGKKNESGV